MKIKNPKKYFLVLLFFSLVFSFAFFLFPKNSNAALNISPLKNLTSGLVGYWTMDGKDTVWTSSTAATTLDKSGNNNTGTLTSMTQSIATAAGKIGQGLKFNGVNSYVNLNDNNSVYSFIQNTAVFTISVWVKLNSLTSRQVLISNVLSIPKGFFFMWETINTTNGQKALRMALANGTAIFLDCHSDNNATILDTKWHHVIVTANNSNPTFYVDGVEKTTTCPTSLGTLSTGNSIYKTWIGEGNNNGSPLLPLNALLDDMRIYNRALSATEITALYNLGSNSHLNVSPLKNLTSGLVGYWTMDGKDTVWTSSTAATTLDKSGNNNTGTLTSMTQSIATAAGKIGQGLKFANNDNAYVVTASDLIGVGGITFSAWVKMNSFGGGGVGRIISNGKFALRVQNIGGGRLYFSSDNETSSAVSASGSFLPNKWNFVTVTRTSATTANANIYINGILSGTANQNSGTPASTVNPDYIGRAVATGNAFDGLIDDARIYSRILSTTEIKQLYNMGR